MEYGISTLQEHLIEMAEQLKNKTFKLYKQLSKVVSGPARTGIVNAEGFETKFQVKIFSDGKTFDGAVSTREIVSKTCEAINIVLDDLGIREIIEQGWLPYLIYENVANEVRKQNGIRFKIIKEEGDDLIVQAIHGHYKILLERGINLALLYGFAKNIDGIIAHATPYENIPKIILPNGKGKLYGVSRITTVCSHYPSGTDIGSELIKIPEKSSAINPVIAASRKLAGFQSRYFEGKIAVLIVKDISKLEEAGLKLYKDKPDCFQAEEIPQNLINGYYTLQVKGGNEKIIDIKNLGYTVLINH